MFIELLRWELDARRYGHIFCISQISFFVLYKQFRSIRDTRKSTVSCRNKSKISSSDPRECLVS